MGDAADDLRIREFNESLPYSDFNPRGFKTVKKTPPKPTNPPSERKELKNPCQLLYCCNGTKEWGHNNPRPKPVTPPVEAVELREQVLTEFKNVLRLAPADYTENCTNVVMSLLQTEITRAEIESSQDTCVELREMADSNGGFLTSKQLNEAARIQRDKLAHLKEGK